MREALESMVICGRSEVALRVERTCRRLGIEVFEGTGEATENPLCPDAESLVARAKAAGAKAIHPGFVSPRSRAEIALLARGAGLVFIGPSSEALALMADKLALRARAADVGVHVVPGCDHALTDVEDALAEAERLDYPLVLKPVAGVAGIGVRRVDDEDELREAFARSTEDAIAAFGDGRLYLEREIFRPRQLEMTIIVDEAGTIVTSGERECSIQRDGRVLLTEAPSPHLASNPEGESIRELLVDVAHRLAQVLSLRGGAISMEVLVDPDGHVYFLEANADMQGGMLATEMLTGVDPVELAIELSRGAPNIDEARLESNGHAFDVRLCAEGERAAGTKVEELRFPPAPHGKVRVEPNVEVGDEVPPEPVLARIATFAPGRHDALLALDRTLAETSVGEIATNVSFLRSVLNHESFRAGQYDVRFTDRLGA